MTELSKEYGTALFMLACENHCQHAYAEALDSLKNTFLENPQYMALLSSPSISLRERLAILDEAFAAALPEHVLSYMKLLCERGRMSYFTESVDVYKALLDASERVCNVKVTSAVPLTEEEKEKLIRKLESMGKGKVQATYFVDRALLGGVIVDVDGEIMDGSLRHHLSAIKEVMNS